MPSEATFNWSGGRIGNGASVFHFAATSSPSVAQGAVSAIHAFFNTIRTLIPSGITITDPLEVRVLDAGGTLVQVIPVNPQSPVLGSGTGAWQNGAGGMIRWSTASVVGGRRLLGRTYIVPMRSTAFTAGNMDPAASATLSVAGTDLISAMAGVSAPLQVWSRKNAVVAPVIAATVPARPSGLRTRNDRA